MRTPGRHARYLIDHEPVAGTITAMQRPDPAVWDESTMRRVLIIRDIAGIFRMLKHHGFTQRQLAELCGMKQNQVSEILKGRRVMAYDVLVRICEGLGAPRGSMGLSYDEELPQEVSEEMKRRALMAAGSIALFGSPILGEVLHIPVRPQTPTPLPSRLGASDVTAMRSLTESLRTVARTYGGGAEVITGVAHRSLPLMSVSASDEVRVAMASALANLHNMAGWTCVDSGLHDQARACFAKAMDLAKIANDSKEMTSAFHHAGIQMRDAGAYNDALKAFQIGLVGAESPQSIAWLHGETAWPWALMGYPEHALTGLKKSREQPLTDPFELAEMDYLTACVYWKLGKLDRAENIAISSVRKWEDEGVAKRDSVEADILLATLHASAGEPDTVMLARKAISGVAGLQSVRARQVKLVPLVQALETRHTRQDFKDLAVHARRVIQSVRQPANL
jgi:transcriptional regulator with XRE-family HTH domain